MYSSCYFKNLVAAALLVLLGATAAHAQFTAQWLDIGTFHGTYVESGAQDEVNSTAADGMEWPAILRNSSHFRAKAFWIGTKDWTDPNGQNWPYFRGSHRAAHRRCRRNLPRTKRSPVSRTEDTVVEVDGALSFDNVAVLDEIDPGHSSGPYGAQHPQYAHVGITD